MAVYVDPLIVYPNAWGPFKGGSCHMMSPDIEELHRFAASIGLKRAWYQDHPKHPHYDLTKSKRVMAVNGGAVEVSSREIVRLWREARIDAPVA